MANDYMDQANAVAATLQDYYKNEEDWQVSKKTKEGATIFYKPSKEFQGYLYKGEIILNTSPETVFHYIDPVPEGPRSKWDSNMKKMQILEWLDKPHLRVNRACTSSACMGLISPRDFVDLILTRETEAGFSTNAISIKYDGCPEEKKYVRGWNYPCGILCLRIPEDPNKTKVVSLIQPNIGGMLPQTLVDSAIPGSMTEFFAELKGALKNDGKLSS